MKNIHVFLPILLITLGVSSTHAVDVSDQLSPFKQAIEFFYRTYTAFDEFMNPPLTIEQAKGQIIAGLQSLETRKYANEMAGLFDVYDLYKDDPSAQRLERLAERSTELLGTIDNEIRTAPAAISAHLAVAYNLLVPMTAAIVKEAGTSENHIAKAIFDRAIETNTILLGGDLLQDAFIPGYSVNAQIYFHRDVPHNSILLEAFQNDAMTENQFIDAVAYVWDANEELRKRRIDGYLETSWYKITDGCDIVYADGRPMNCLHGSSSRGVTVKEECASRDDNFLWKFEFVNHRSFRIVHSSGSCLEVRRLQEEEPLLLAPCLSPIPNSGDATRQLWSFHSLYKNNIEFQASPFSISGADDYFTLFASGVLHKTKSRGQDLPCLWHVRRATSLDVNIVSISPSPLKVGNTVLFIARTAEPGDTAKIGIIVNDVTEKTCTKSPCWYIGGPYSEDVTFYAIASNKKNGKTWTDKKYLRLNR